jgi:hypothetical protein
MALFLRDRTIGGGGDLPMLPIVNLKNYLFFYTVKRPTMKLLILLSFLLVISLQAYSQMDPEKALYIAKSEKYRKMKGTGAALTVTGGILAIVGLVTLSNAETTTTSNGYGQQTQTSGNVGAGAAAWIFGNIGLGAGIPLWIVGKNNERKYVQKLENMSVSFNTSPQRTGLTLRYRF